MCFTLRLHTSAAPPRVGLTQALGRMTDLSQFKRIWSEPGWVVIRHVEDHEHLVVVFEHGANIHDLKALRDILPELASAPASDLMHLKGARQFDLGEHESALVQRLRSLCASRQLLVLDKGRQIIQYDIFNEQTRAYCIIEDEELLKAVATEAIRHGMPVRDSIA